jgi:hypothetical protein
MNSSDPAFSGESSMRGTYHAALTAAALVMLSAVSSADRLYEGKAPGATAQRISVPTGGNTPGGVVSPPSVIVVDNQDVEGILGKEVRSIADENMGRIVEVIVDRSGQVRAAIIDFGGFLGVGSRKIAVDWNALHFPLAGDPRARITVELTQDQVRAAPDYKAGKPVVILGALSSLPSLPFTGSPSPEW